jgi:glutamyl/glutaminyl-tRNA synthetase
LRNAFDIDRVQKSGAQFNDEKLMHLNREHMRQLLDEAYVALGQLSAPQEDRLYRAIPILKERAHTFGEAREMLMGELSCLFTTPELHPELLRKKEPEDRPEASKQALEATISVLKTLPALLPAEAVKWHLCHLRIAKRRKGREVAVPSSGRSATPFLALSAHLIPSC